MIHIEPAAAAISMNPTDKERSNEEGHSNVLGDDSKKSERKRQRERQRRSDLATAFDELASLVGQIDPDEASHSTKRRRQRKGSLGEAGGSDVASVSAEDPSAMTRLDLIQRTIEVLRRLQRENAVLRQRVEQSGRNETDSEREVLVMVPTLSPADPDLVQHHAELANRSANYPPPPPPPPHYYPQMPPPHDGMYGVPPQNHIPGAGHAYYGGAYYGSGGTGVWGNHHAGHPLGHPPHLEYNNRHSTGPPAPDMHYQPAHPHSQPSDRSMEHQERQRHHHQRDDSHSS